MFTIKVVRTDNSGQTLIYEAVRPWYQRRTYVNKKEWLSIFNALYSGQPLELCMDSPIDDGSHQDAPYSGEGKIPDNISGEFLQINGMDENGNLRIIFAQNATIYIMHEGQTVDKIYC